MSFVLKSLPWALVAATALMAAPARAADSPGCAANGPLASALPPRLLFGIASSTPDDEWAKNSGTKWDVQWIYLAGQAGNNWYNTWGGGAGDGSFAGDLFRTVDSYGFIPGIHLYNMGYGHDGGDAGLVTEIQDKNWTKAYFTEFKGLMAQAKDFGKPIVMIIEGDSFGMVEMLTKNKPDTMAAVASSGVPELADLPDTVAGFGMAYLALRKSVGADNVMMGIDTPYYAANGDIMNYAYSEELAPHRDYQWTFFGSFNGENQTGERFDFMAAAVDAADCGYYQAQGDDRCWDPSDDAPINSKSINRYVEWMRLMNESSGLPWVLHQFPLGNSQHENIPFDGSPRSGYEDNRAEYLLQYEEPASPEIRDQHLANFANAGVIAILFGFSDDGVTPATDLWKDDQPFLSTHVAELNNENGGFPITRSDGTTCTATGSGGTSGTGGSSPSGGSGAMSEGGQAGDVTPASGGTSTSAGRGGRSGSAGAAATSGSSGMSSGPGGTGTGGSSTGTGTGGTSAGGTSTGGTSNGTGATSGSAGAGNAPTPPADEKVSGTCGCRLVGEDHASMLRGAPTLLLVLGLLARRRRRAQNVVA